MNSSMTAVLNGALVVVVVTRLRWIDEPEIIKLTFLTGVIFYTAEEYSPPF
jgi:hypothetical protein